MFNNIFNMPFLVRFFFLHRFTVEVSNIHTKFAHNCQLTLNLLVADLFFFLSSLSYCTGKKVCTLAGECVLMDEIWSECKKSSHSDRSTIYSIYGQYRLVGYSYLVLTSHSFPKKKSIYSDRVFEF